MRRAREVDLAGPSSALDHGAIDMQRTNPSVDVRFGDPRLPQRFWDRVMPTLDDCWVWLGAVSHNGYGIFGCKGNRRAHRHAYSALVGPVPADLDTDHLCRVRPCVNPAHIEPVTTRENTLRGDTIPAKNAAKTHCPQGHPLVDGNLCAWLLPWRSCLTCKHVDQHKSYLKRVARKHIAKHARIE